MFSGKVSNSTEVHILRPNLQLIVKHLQPVIFTKDKVDILDDVPSVAACGFLITFDSDDSTVSPGAEIIAIKSIGQTPSSFEQTENESDDANPSTVGLESESPAGGQEKSPSARPETPGGLPERTPPP